MQRLAELQARIRSLGELREVVGALRSLSAVRVQQAHEILVGIRQYTSTIEGALADAAARLPPSAPAGRRDPWDAVPSTTVVAFGSEHGFVGAFNEHVLDCAAAHLQGRGNRLLVAGSRAALLATERHYVTAWTCPMAAHIGGVDRVALNVAEEIGRQGTADIGRVVLIYTRSSGGATWRLVAETLLPFDIQPYMPLRRDRPIPLSNLPPRELFEKLIEEIVFAQLTHAAMESFASENAARLVAMESAQDNIDDKLTGLGRLESEGRQEEITTELLDVVTGATAIADEYS